MRPWQRYFFPRQPLPPVPRQLIAPYDIRTASEEQKLAIMAGKARSPQAAETLFRQYGVNTAHDLLHSLPSPQRHSFGSRLLALLWRWSGHYRPRRPRQEPDTIPQVYQFRDTRKLIDK